MALRDKRPIIAVFHVLSSTCTSCHDRNSRHGSFTLSQPQRSVDSDRHMTVFLALCLEYTCVEVT